MTRCGSCTSSTRSPSPAAPSSRLVEEVEALADRFDQRVVRLYARDELQPRWSGAGIPVVGLGLSGRHAGRTWPWAAVALAP